MIKDKCMSINIPVEELDGFRMLIVENKHYADYWDMHYYGDKKELASTKKLKDDFLTFKTITWEEYEKEFREQMAKSEKAQKLMKEWAEKYANSETEHVTLLCFCKDRNICHRRLVKEMILSINNQSINQ